MAPSAARVYKVHELKNLIPRNHGSPQEPGRNMICINIWWVILKHRKNLFLENNQTANMEYSQLNEREHYINAVQN